MGDQCLLGVDAVSFEFLEIAVQAGMAVYTVNRLRQMQVENKLHPRDVS